LIALDAKVTLVSQDGERTIPLTDLYSNDGMAYLEKRPDEILKEVHLPPPTENWRSTYWKLRRRGSFDFPVLSVAAALRFGKSNVVEDAHVVLGAVASRPFEVPAAAMLVGETLTDQLIEAFAEEGCDLAKPLDNTDFVYSWRKRIARTFLAGALRELRGDDPSTFGLLARRAATARG
jgi:CO/xanthine dehydrogenase FAD-binding subunit